MLNVVWERFVELSIFFEDEKNYSVFFEVFLENEKDKNDEFVKIEKIVVY